MNFLFGGNFLIALILTITKNVETSNSLIHTNTNQTVSKTDKMKHISKQKVLRVATEHFVPYMYQNENGKFYSGSEYKLVKMMAKKFKMRLSFQSTSKHLHPCDNVISNISDICIGGVFPRENELKDTDMSLSYTSDDLTWCVQKAKIMPLYLSHMLTFTPDTWFLIIFGYGYTSGLVLYLLIQFDPQYTQRNNRDWHYTTMLVALPACLGTSSTFRPTGNNTRIFYTFMLFGTFFFFQIIFVSSFELLHKQVPWHQVSTFEEIINNDFRMVGSQISLKLSREIANHKIEFSHICKDINECIDLLLNDDKMAIGGSRQNIMYSPSYSPSTVFCLDSSQNIGSYPIALYIKKDFALKKEIQDYLRQLIASGFFEMWNRRPPNKNEATYVIPLQLPLWYMNVLFIFLLGGGSFISTSAFIAEKIIFWKMKQRDKSKTWIYLQQLFDGKRHYFKNVPARLQRQNKNVSEPNFSYLE